MQSEIDNPITFGPPSEIDSLKQRISELKAENDKIRAENNKIMAENFELKARVAKLEDMRLQNEIVKNLLSVSRKTKALHFKLSSFSSF